MAVSRILAALDRSARWALAAGVFTGILVPALAAALRPLLVPVVISTLAMALLRLDWHRLAAAAMRPALPIALVGWLLVAAPQVMWGLCLLVGAPPDLRLVLVLQAAAPPIGSAAVFALILGYEGSIALVATVAATLLLPFTLTPVVGLLLSETGVRVDLVAFFLRATTLVALPFLIAWLVRRLIGPARLAAVRVELGGLNVLLLVVFALAVMDGVTARLLAEPGALLRLVALACASALAMHVAAWWLFRRAGITAGINAVIASGSRNMGLMLVVTAGTAGDTFALYVAVAQLPMYCAPLLLSPWAARLRRAATTRP